MNIELLLAAELYERFLVDSGTPPEAGVYTAARPITKPNGRPIVRPSNNLTIAVETTPEGEFTMEGEKSTLAGTFEYSYGSATGSHAPRSQPALCS